ncbi:MAG TPA: CopD family protein [Rhizomicrobium sp.]|nr:CopD family protein [Rhizomicrobium sp.]
MTTLFALVRALHFAGLMTVFGASALLFQARPVGVDGKALKAPLCLAALAALVTAALSLGFVAQDMTGDARAFGDLHMLAAVVTASFYGKIFLWRIFLLLGLCLACAAPGFHLPKALVAGAALALPGLTSHAAAAGPAQYEVARAGIDALHLLAAGFWVGGLVVLAREMLARPRDTQRLVALLRLFSRWGTVSVAVLLAAGTLNAVAILAPQGMRWSETYITLLALKIVLAAVMVALALTNRFGVLPGLARGEPEAEDTIPLTVLAELSCAVLILLLVGFLGLTAPMQM